MCIYIYTYITYNIVFNINRRFSHALKSACLYEHLDLSNWKGYSHKNWQEAYCIPYAWQACFQMPRPLLLSEILKFFHCFLCIFTVNLQSLFKQLYLIVSLSLQYCLNIPLALSLSFSVSFSLAVSLSALFFIL